jgi:hypothetical protein
VLCGRKIARAGVGRRRIYCSRACQQRAYRMRQEETMWPGLGGDDDDQVDVTALLNAAIRSRPRR